MLVGLISELLRWLDRLLDDLIVLKGTVGLLRGVELDRFRRVLLRHLLSRFEHPIQQTILRAERYYVNALHGYFIAVNSTLQRHVARYVKTPPQDHDHEYNANNMTANGPSTFQRKMNYLEILFNDSPEVVRLIQCFASMEAFEESLIPFPEPVVRERRRIWKSTYTLECDLDEKLLDVLIRFQKEDFYPLIVQKLHDNVPMLKVVVGIMLKAIEYHEQPAVIVHKLNEIWTDVYDLALNMLYQWLISLNGTDIQAVFGNLLKKFAAFNDQLPQWINQLREDLLINNHVASANAENQQQPQQQHHQVHDYRNCHRSSTVAADQDTSIIDATATTATNATTTTTTTHGNHSCSPSKRRRVSKPRSSVRVSTKDVNESDRPAL